MPPDAIVSARLPSASKGMPHSPMKLPPSFQACSQEAIKSLILERLESILPEVEAPVAVGYLEDAALLLSLSRSHEGIRASASNDLVPLFDSVLRTTPTGEVVEKLEGIMVELKESSVMASNCDGKALRAKGVFHLLRAATLLQRSSPSTSTA